MFVSGGAAYSNFNDRRPVRKSLCTFDPPKKMTPRNRKISYAGERINYPTLDINAIKDGLSDVCEKTVSSEPG